MPKDKKEQSLYKDIIKDELAKLIEKFPISNISGFIKDNILDFSAPLGDRNLYKSQGGSSIGPLTGVQHELPNEDNTNNVKNIKVLTVIKEAMRIYNSLNKGKSLIKAEIKSLIENKILKEVRSTQLMNFMSSLKNNSFIEKVVSTYSLADSVVSLIRGKDGNAYEIEIRPASKTQHKDIFGKFVDKK